MLAFCFPAVLTRAAAGDARERALHSEGERVDCNLQLHRQLLVRYAAVRMTIVYAHRSSYSQVHALLLPRPQG